MGTQLPPLQKRHSPQFLGHVCCGQTAGWIKMPLRMNVDLSPGHIVLDEDPAPPTKNGHSSPKFWPMSVVAKWLDGSRCQLVWMEVGLSPGDIVLDGDLAPSQKGHSTPDFQPTWPNRWMNQDATWCSHRPWPRPNCIRWGPSSLRNGHSNPLFSAHVYCGLTVVHLSYC